MRKQNSKFKTSFLSEEGTELRNLDCFSYIELSDFACYVLSDGLPGPSKRDPGRMAAEEILSRFQARPACSKRALHSYLRGANESFRKEGEERPEASVLLVLTDYRSFYYAGAGNVRLRLYRNGETILKSRDNSYAAELAEREEIPEDAVSLHEERQNLSAYLGQKHFHPYLSKRIPLSDSDILLLYTKGIWENLHEGEIAEIFEHSGADGEESLALLEKSLLDRHPARLDNYSAAAIYVDKVFLETDSGKRRRRRRIICALLLCLLLFFLLFLASFFYRKWRRELREDLQSYRLRMESYLELENFGRAREECEKAEKKAELLRDREERESLNRYLEALSAILDADEKFSEKRYQDAKSDYELLLRRLPYADNVGLDHIRERIRFIDGSQLVERELNDGEILFEAGVYEGARERYREAKDLSRELSYEEGKIRAEEKLTKLEKELAKQQSEEKSAAEEQAGQLVRANSLISAGDQALKDGDLLSAKANYETAKALYEKSGESAGADSLSEKMDSLSQRIQADEEEGRAALRYRQAGDDAAQRGEYEKAEENYDYARRIYQKLREEIEVISLDQRIRDMQRKREEQKDEEGQRETGDGRREGKGEEGDNGKPSGESERRETEKGAEESGGRETAKGAERSEGVEEAMLSAETGSERWP